MIEMAWWLFALIIGVVATVMYFAGLGIGLNKINELENKLAKLASLIRRATGGW